MQVVTINSQGQVTIPIHLRRKLGFEQSKKAVVKEEKGRVVFEPVPNIDTLAGSLKRYAIKDKSMLEVLKLEDRAIDQARAEKFQKKNRLTQNSTEHKLLKI
jgi:bifunctional DNA-binding transcriptional regulator/antitoxin component of YhaV-PrlF toxin-antitoxin module